MGAHTNIVPFGFSTSHPSVESVDKNVAAAGVDLFYLIHVGVGLVEGDDRRNLNGPERAVVEVGLQLGKCSDHFHVADREPNPPASHRVTFGEGVQLNPYISRTRNLQETRWVVSVKGHVGLGEIVNEKHVVVFGERHETLEEIELDTHCRRVVRKRCENNAWLRP